MKEWAIRIFLLGVLAAAGFWAWTVLYPNPEKVIRKRLAQVVKEASFSSDQGLVAQAWNASSFAENFTPDVEVELSVPGIQHTISGRDELMQAVMAVRRTVRSLRVSLPDIKVNVAPDGTSAEVYVTAEARVPGEREFYLQELRLRLIKVNRDWLISHAQTIKTLSQQADAPLALPAA
jgi:hypothetical protein